MLINKLMAGQLQQNPLMNQFNQMMAGKNPQQQIQTLINAAKSRGINVNDKCFTDDDLRMLGLK